jgi:predicted CoA-binding protein
LRTANDNNLFKVKKLKTMGLIEEMLKNSKTIAVIGLKESGDEVSNKVSLYMKKHGYRIIPVNPVLAGKKVLGEVSFSDVAEISEKVDLVNIFRRPEFLEKHASEILKMKQLPKYVWFQLGIYNDKAADTLMDAGVKVIQNRCIMVEHTNLKRNY